MQAEITLKARSKAQQKLEELEGLLLSHKQSERERQYAKRYHKVSSDLTSPYFAAVPDIVKLSVPRSLFEVCFIPEAIPAAQVRFFERVKLERRIKQLEASLPSSSTTKQASLQPELVKLQKDLQVPDSFNTSGSHTALLFAVGSGNLLASRLQCLVGGDLFVLALQYVKYFPPGRKYVSVLKKATTPEGQDQLELQRQSLRSLVDQRMANEALVAEPDEGQSLVAAGLPAAQVR